MFYTNIDKIAPFGLLHENIAPLIRRISGTSNTRQHRQFKSTPKKFGPDTKFSLKDELLLTLMKLRLGILTADLADRFRIFYSWIRGMSEYLKSFTYMPDTEAVLATSPKRYKSFSNLISIIGCSEIFIETPRKFGATNSYLVLLQTSQYTENFSLCCTNFCNHISLGG